MNAEAYPRRLELRRSARPWQFVRAMFVILVGAAIFVAALNLRRLVSLPENPALDNALKCVGGFVAISGGIGLLYLLIASRGDRGEVIEVDETGLTHYKEGNKNKRSLKWADVTAYEVQTSGGSSLDIESWTGASSRDADLAGCLFGILLGLWVMFLQFFIGDPSWTVRFKLRGKKRGFSISGQGGAMDELITIVLPHYLPGKLVTAGDKSTAQNS